MGITLSKLNFHKNKKYEKSNQHFKILFNENLLDQHNHSNHVCLVDETIPEQNNLLIHQSSSDNKPKNQYLWNDILFKQNNLVTYYDFLLNEKNNDLFDPQETHDNYSQISTLDSVFHSVNLHKLEIQNNFLILVKKFRNNEIKLRKSI